VQKKLNILSLFSCISGISSSLGVKKKAKSFAISEDCCTFAPAVTSWQHKFQTYLLIIKHLWQLKSDCNVMDAKASPSLALSLLM